MNYDEETFYHGKPSSKNGIKNDSNKEKYKREERPLPSLRNVAWVA
jgi:hypothetical protein